MNKYGSYDNYIQNIYTMNSVNDEFILKYYPTVVNDITFKNLLIELDPIMRDDIEFVTILYDLLNSYNEEVSGILERKDTLI